MAIVSAILYFISHHPFLAWPFIALFWFGIGVLMARWRKSPGWIALGTIGMVGGMINLFTGSIFNAAFLAAFGTAARAPPWSPGFPAERSCRLDRSPEAVGVHIQRHVAANGRVTLACQRFDLLGQVGVRRLSRGGKTSEAVGSFSR